MNEKIRNLQFEINLEQMKMDKCKHIFMKALYNPETIKEGYGCVQDGAGSDPHWSYEGYKDVQKPRWTRICEDCGYEQHTYKRKEVVSKTEPDFS